VAAGATCCSNDETYEVSGYIHEQACASAAADLPILFSYPVRCFNALHLMIATNFRGRIMIVSGDPAGLDWCLGLEWFGLKDAGHD
jgi:hypothetical protein